MGVVHIQVHTLAHLSPNPSKSGWVGSDTVLTSRAFPSLFSNAQRAPPGPGHAGAGEAQGSHAEKAGKGLTRPMFFVTLWAWSSSERWQDTTRACKGTV